MCLSTISVIVFDGRTKIIWVGATDDTVGRAPYQSCSVRCKVMTGDKKVSLLVISSTCKHLREGEGDFHHSTLECRVVLD